MALDALLLLAEAAHLEEQPRLEAASHKRPRATPRCEQEEQDAAAGMLDDQEVHHDGSLPRRSRRRCWPHPRSAAPVQQFSQEAFSFGHRQERPVASWSGFGAVQATSSVHSELSLGQWRGNAGSPHSVAAAGGANRAHHPTGPRFEQAEEPAHLQDDADSASTCSSASCACSSASTEDTASDDAMMILGELDQEEEQVALHPPSSSGQAAAAAAPDFSFPALWHAPQQVVLSW